MSWFPLLQLEQIFQLDCEQYFLLLSTSTPFDLNKQYTYLYWSSHPESAE